MGATHRFIADPTGPSEVLDWFRRLPAAPAEVPTERGVALHFRECGPLTYRLGAGMGIDAKASPIANVFLPRIRRGVLWTLGEVHFLATALHKISNAFSRWLSTHECVHGRKQKDDRFAYYLEGSIRNHDSPVFALASGLEALEAQRYFVDDDDTEFRLDTICRYLRLRGVECSGA